MLRILHIAPFRLQLGVGILLGWLTWATAAKPRKTVRRNIDAYFSGLDRRERRALERRSFASLGMTIVEVPFGWWASPERLRRRYTIDGLEHIETARQGGRGVLLLGFHFTTVEFCGVMLCQNFPDLYAVYRPYRKNPLADEFTRRYRGRAAREMIDRGDLATIVRRLRDKKVVFFAGDQIVRRGKRCEELPFFGVPTLFHSGAIDLARMTGASIVPYIPQRLSRGRYHVQILPPLEGIPSGDRRADMAHINALLERYVARDPAQYLWARDRLA